MAEEKENNNINKEKKGGVLAAFKEIPNKKPYIEVVTAVLTIPVLLTVIFLNVDRINGEEENPIDSKDDGEKTIVITQSPGESIREKEVVVTKEACEPGIGEVTISSPLEGENTSNNPLFIDIDYDANGFCNIIWSYRVNGGEWSSYDDRSISLYNLENGEVKLDLRIKSVVNSDSESMTRTFIYNGAPEGTSPTATLTPTPSN